MNTQLIATILGIVLSLKVAATLIVNLTPTPKDNDIVGKVYAFVEVLAGLWTSKAKEVNETTGK